MLSGLSKAPSSFQRLINTICDDLSFLNITLDNLVHSKSIYEHVKHLEILFQCIHNADVMFHGSKCQIGWLFLTYLGHLFLEAGMPPSHETYGYISNDSSCPWTIMVILAMTHNFLEPYGCINNDKYWMLNYHIKGRGTWTQVDILISKSQALQILYLKHCVYKTT